ncbi:MAG: LLM class F420-dependent oxidoreductase [Candidatus Bathyarchaeia archaeon]|jgi:probable F420-dependent oxidoreductase
MRVGFFLPQIGPVADTRTIIKVAKRAEELKYDSLWVTERLLYPTNPQTSYYGHALPEPYKRVFDPLETLTFAAAHTSRVALGTSVLDIPFYNPVLLARRLTTLDVLSGGRLRVGFGLGWSQDENDAAGANMKVRGKRADEFIKVLKTIWTTDPAEFHGKFFQLPKSIIQPKPVQKPHPPIYLAAFSPASLKRTATLADGWMPVGSTLSQLESTTGQLKSMAKSAGRDPASMKVIARYNITVTTQPQGKDRAFFSGTLDQLKEDVDAVKKFAPDELILDPTFSPDSQTEEGFLNNLDQIRKLV